ncbi:RagB/SusD family nutrient uptake outer membrane protein [Sphingobacterium paucimobilis]|uniref:SusD-like N-terminal domain-containing protein n=1 Tax=Sphingobacterium paucimobilis HER1398 TaxID=1346330 RepID=U2HAN5_9SPHI|nr:RagB/SusD family nutrient uptake outer membrane protein [Sphingobacterium paucimobilis]ERJ58811.1 hypothetical protein M472_08520 [Sphingobacterium paucimobilis HER1398]
MKTLNIIALLFCLSSCDSSFLEVKPSMEIDLLTDYDDLENLLENGFVFGKTGNLKLAACDDYYIVSRKDYDAMPSMTEKNVYVWNERPFAGEPNQADWNGQYKAVFYANAVLDRLAEIDDSGNGKRRDFIRGTALFYRAYAYADMVTAFCPVFDPTDEDVGSGLPLRRSADIDKMEGRSSVHQTYSFIITDLLEAVDLLDGKPFPLNNPNRASQEAAFALLARLYLAMGDYPNATLYADHCLQKYDKLIDYNSICLSCATPFEKDLSEVIYFSNHYTNNAFLTSINEILFLAVDTLLLEKYSPHDLRFPIMYMKNRVGNYNKKRGYILGGGYDFSGLATDEIYLIRAEGYARTGQHDLAIADINTLLKNRFETGRYTDIQNIPDDQLLELILDERRKSLAWRGLRWSDLKRLNKEGWNINLYRDLDGTMFHLPPNSSFYVFPIPEEETIISTVK